MQAASSNFLPPSDERYVGLIAWLHRHFAGQHFTLEPASADASFRRYYRVFVDGASIIAVDAPPSRENIPAFLKVAHLFAQAGVHVPKIVATDLSAGYLLVSDLGRHTYLHMIDEANADELFADATDTLLKIQLASEAGQLPPYESTLLRREIQLFPEWYVGRHLGRTLTDPQQAVWDRISSEIITRALATPAVYVHRDFMPRNLMVSTPNPGVLDFQDAVYGPITYDIAALLKDAFVSWDEERVLDVTIRYWQKARKSGLPVGDDFGEFYANVEWMGLQRHLKILGIFSRINYRDGKPHYLPDTPRFVRYVRAVCGRYGALAPLLGLIDELHEAHPIAGYSF